MRAIGADLSLTSTGVASRLGVRTIKPRLRRGPDRLAFIRDEVWGEVAGLVTHPKDAVVFVEGYNFGAPRATSTLASLGELGGVVRLMLWERGVTYVEIPPSVLKKFATGRGNASKEEVLIEAVKRAPSDMVIAGNDTADAWWLYVLGCELLGEPVVEMPALNRSALTKLLWPPVELADAL